MLFGVYLKDSTFWLPADVEPMSNDPGAWNALAVLVCSLY